MRELERIDPEIYQLIGQEERYQLDSIRLIPSENYVSKAVLEATGSVLTNKYSEGYPGRRYYEGQRYIDQIESLVIERARALFGAQHVNVQPYSGSPANLAVYFAINTLFARTFTLDSGPLALHLPVLDTLSPVPLVIAVVAAVLVFAARWPVLRVLGVSAALGLGWAAIAAATGLPVV